MGENDLENGFRPEDAGTKSAREIVEKSAGSEKVAAEKPESLGRKFLNFQKEAIKNADFGVFMLEGIAALLVMTIGISGYRAATTDWRQAGADYEKEVQKAEAEYRGQEAQRSIPDTAVVHQDGRISLENTQTPAGNSSSEKSDRTFPWVTYAAGGAAIWAAHEMENEGKKHGR